jgi:hypothetical protein
MWSLSAPPIYSGSDVAVLVTWDVAGQSGTRAVACVDTAASLVLGVFGSIIGEYPMEALAEVMTNVAAPLWREMTTEGRQCLQEGRTWERRAPGLLVVLQAHT